MSWLPMWSWFKRSNAPSAADPEPKQNKNNRDRVYANNGNTSSQTISKERDLISRTKINETKQLLLSIKDLATTLESLPLDDLLTKTEPQPLKQESDAVDKRVDVTNNEAAPSTELAEESLSEEDPISDQVSQESETLTIGSDESQQESDHSSQSNTSKSPGRGLVRGTGVSVSQHGDMIWDERRGWVSRTGHEDVLQVELFDTHTPPSTPLSADLPQDFVLNLNTDRLAHEHAQLGAWMQARASAELDRSYLHLIRTMSIMKMVREVETVRRMMSDSDSDEDDKSRVNSVSQNGAASVSDKPSRVMSDKLRQFVDEREEEEDDIVLPDKPLKLVHQTPVPESAFPSELKVELDTKTSNGHTAHTQGQAASDTKTKVKRGKGLKLVPAQATFSDELVFDDEPKKSSAVSASASGKKDLSAFVDEDEQPVKSVKSKPSKMKLITLDSLPAANKKHVAPLPSLASAAVQSVSDKQDEELFDDIELPSAADLKRRIKALRPNTNTSSAGLLMKRHSSGKIDSGALEDWCEDEDDDAPLNSAPNNKKSAVNNNTRGANLLTVK